MGTNLALPGALNASAEGDHVVPSSASWVTLLQFPSDAEPNGREGQSLPSGRESEAADAKDRNFAGQALVASGDAWWELDPVANVATLSPNWKSTLGYLESDRFETISAWLDLAPDEDRPAIRDILWGRRDRFSVTCRLKRRDGAYGWYLVRGSVTRDEQGRPTAVRGLLTDIRSAKLREQASQRREVMLREVAEASSEAMSLWRAITSAEGQVVEFELVEMNERAGALLGVERSRGLGCTLGEIAPTASEQGLILRCAAVMESRAPHVEELHAVPGGLQEIWLRQTILPVTDGVAILSADISASKRAADANQRTRRLFERVAAASPDMHYVWSLETGRFVYRNRDLVALLDMEDEEDGEGRASIWSLLHPDDEAILRAHLDALASRPDDDVLQETVRLRSADGTFRWFRFRESVFERNVQGRPVQIFGVAQDVTHQKAYESELEQRMADLRRAQQELELRHNELEELNQRLGNLALTDGLTGLKNHRAFQERLSEEVDRAQRYNLRLALVFADVDDFKMYNDRYGHPGGDGALKAFAGVLVAVSRSSDLAVRYGGEEFALILPNTSAAEASCLCERIRVRLADTEFGKRGITASYGCAEFRPGRNAKDQLVSDADQALYRSKHAGKDRISTAGSD